MFECDICHRIFTRKLSLQYHTKKNVCLKKKKKLVLKQRPVTNAPLPVTNAPLPITNAPLPTDISVNDTPYENSSKRELYEVILRLNGEIKALKENPRTVNNTTYNSILTVPPAFLVKMVFLDRKIHKY
jgi:hypothetical protein